jgi:hypothetical protein
MISPSFSLNLGHSTSLGCVAGQLLESGQNAPISLAFATSGGRILVQDSKSGGIRFLNVNRHVTSLSVARLQLPSISDGIISNSSSTSNLSSRDVLLVGTKSSIQCFDLVENRDVFFKETPEAVTATAACNWQLPPLFSSTSQTNRDKGSLVCFGGGNCALTGFDAMNGGNEVIWGVSGDVVSAMCISDLDGDGEGELIVGSKDCEIRVLKGPDLDPIFEATEADAITSVADLSPSNGIGNGITLTKTSTSTSVLTSASIDNAINNKITLAPVKANAINQRPRLFAFALENGTVGVYAVASSLPSTAVQTSASGSSKNSSSLASAPGGLVRLWRLRGKGKATAVCAFDFDKDGESEVVCAWSTGRIEIRKATTGELLFRDTISSPSGLRSTGGGITGICVTDYRGDQRPMLIAVSSDGDLRAYAQVDAAALAAHKKASGLALEGAGETLTSIVKGSTLSTTSGAQLVQQQQQQQPTEADEEVELLALLSEKQKLEAELARLKLSPSSSSSTPLQNDRIQIPSSTEVRVSCSVSLSSKCLELSVSAISADKETFPLRAAAAFSTEASLFIAGREAAVSVPIAHSGTSSSSVGGMLAGTTGSVKDETSLLIQIAPPTNTLGSLKLSAYINVRSTSATTATSGSLIVLDKLIQLPKFALFELIPPHFYGAGSINSNTSQFTSVKACATSSLYSTRSTIVEKNNNNSNTSFMLPPSKTQLKAPPEIPTGYVTFLLHGTDIASRVAAWAPTAFLISDEMAKCLVCPPSPILDTNDGGVPPAELFSPSADQVISPLALDLRFLSIRDGGSTLLRIAITHNRKIDSESHTSWAIVQANDMQLAGEVIQDLSAYLGITNLSSTCYFQREFERLAEALEQVSKCSIIRNKLAAEMAEAVGQAKSLVVQAEDARLRSDMKSMRAAYAQLKGLNAELLREYSKRGLNHEQLVEGLRETNSFIQHAALLRVGEPRNQVVSACRQAVKTNSLTSFLAAVSG